MMLTEFLSLLCLGLCLGYEDEKNERLPKPFFSALPSSVVESKSNVTLKCWSTFQNATFRLGKLNNTGSEEQLKSAENNVELLLTDLEPKDAGKYFCTYKTTASQGWAESEHLQLVVTDEYEGYEAPPIKMGGDENLGTLSSKQDSRIIFITVFSCLSMFLSFFSIFLIYRCVQYDSADGESTRSSHSNFPNQEATDLSKPERTSLSAEDSEGNTRALCEAAYASY
ncbi:V-set and transmembrane domain-containing protein 1-like isoform X2 [Elephas maximus indicus]|uniref:V-set and transmembrane domain-containing protein 1-like isoform X2 n=1 Tax=Elephas maximus indicus TaxID=99487 RepID=UPI002115D7E7|nr:V-set and transmembrane domain-containing protein 1-like isoform X2 [Elephas maximus indicus]